MLSSTAEYALRAVVYLASHSERARTSQEIAESTQVPRGYVSKVLRDLNRARLLDAQRGPNGGFELSREPENLSVLEVVNAVDPVRRITMCPLGIPSHRGNLCRLHQKLDDAIGLVEDSFRTTSIADLLGEAKSSARCPFPPLTVKGKPLAGQGKAQASKGKTSKPRAKRS